MKYMTTKEYVYYEDESRNTVLEKGSIVTFDSYFKDGKCWVNLKKCKYLVDKKDLKSIE